MKTVFSLLVAMLMSLSAFAQSGHLVFKGIPIDGTLEEYVSRLKSVQFKVDDIERGHAKLIGDFAGYKDCSVTVSSVLPRNLVNEITVRFPSCSSWAKVEENYSDLKEMLTQKYGKPSQQTYGNWDFGTDDRTKYYIATRGEANVTCTFATPNGTIHMWIDGWYSNAVVKMTYTDKANTSTVKADAYNDL